MVDASAERGAGKLTFPHIGLHGARERRGVGWRGPAKFSLVAEQFLQSIQRVGPHAIRDIDSVWRSIGRRPEARACRGTGATDRHRGNLGGNLKLADRSAWRIRKDSGERGSPL